MVDAIPGRLMQARYSFNEADRIAGAPLGSTSRWVKGYSYKGKAGRVNLPAITPRDETSNAASFLDLLEVVVIGRFKDAGISVRTVRQIVAECQELMNLPRPLVQLKFKTDGREVFIDEGTSLVGLLRRKHLTAWNDVLAPFLEQLDYSDGWAERWWPMGKGTPVLVDPEYGFGQPVVADTGIRTEILLERFRAGDLPDVIARDFGLDPTRVLRAIQYETTRLAA